MEVNNTTPPSGEGNGVGFFLGIVMLIIFGFFLFYYGLPAVRNTAPVAPTNQQTQPTQELPNNEGTNINIPDKVDIDIEKK